MLGLADNQTPKFKVLVQKTVDQLGMVVID